MSAAIFNFRRPVRPQRCDWSDQELAEFYRVVDALGRAGREVATDRGLTDEGEPWFVFVQPATDEVIAHFARIDGEIVADASALSRPIRGRNLRAVLDHVAEEYTLVLPRSRGNKLFLHPGALLAALVATALLEVEETHAAKPSGDDDRGGGRGDAGRAQGSQAGSVPVNAAGRAVSFNESGLVGETSFSSSSFLMTTIAAVLSLSAHTADASTADGSVALAASATDPGGDIPEAQLRPAADSSGGFSTVSADDPGGDLQAAAAFDMRGAMSPGFIRVDGGALPVESGTDDEVTGAPVELTQDGRSVLVGLDGPQTFTLQPAIQPVAMALTPAPAEAPAEGEANSEGGDADGNGSNGSTSEDGSGLAERVQELLESGRAPSSRPETPPDDGSEQPAEDDRTSPEEAANELRDALASGAAPAPSDLLFEGPSGDNDSLSALGKFFETGAFDTTDLRLAAATASDEDHGFSLLGSRGPLVVAFDSDVPLMEVFSFMPGVVFVNEDLIGPYAHVPDTAAFEFDLANDASVQILGFYEIDEALL